MPPNYTFELEISIAETEDLDLKEQLKSWLTMYGEESFVEGVLDDLDIDHEFEEPKYSLYETYGGHRTPLSVYSYDHEYLLDLEVKLSAFFNNRISCKQKKIETKVWMEGWKESFKPISTKKFYIYPPWEKLRETHLIPIIIDPGMAFGTGQHATTQICLTALENLADQGKNLRHCKLLDVGTGSGILSIAAKKAGVADVYSCDIDANSLIACKENAKVNQVDFYSWKGSVPSGKHVAELGLESFDIVLANILYVVLKDIIGDLAAELKTRGTLILSGILSEQKEAMLQSAERFQLKLVHEWVQNDWVCLVMEKCDEA